MKVTVHDSIADIAANDWNQLAGSAYPFLRHEFLNLAEQTHCVTPAQGWTPRHLSIGKKGHLRAAMPLYEKSHSWGEFVFDWAWARAYEQAGLRYYPKLVSAAPFTPAPSRRLLLADPEDTEGAHALIAAAIALAGESECSSFHILFPTAEEIPLLESAGLLIRKDCQFHWHNRGYENFDDFLATFNAAKRKKAKRDRRRAEENGIRFRRLKGSEMDDSAWSVVYALISRTFMRRGSLPYFNTLPELLYFANTQIFAMFITVGFASARTMMARIAPPSMMTQFFGLYALSGTATAFLAPLLVGAFTSAFQSQRAGFASLIILLSLGFVMMLFVREEQAQPA